ncbi:hypothetical protein JXJ21_10770 [candidate division KSB1 bacterium]|nr:hypothetical protein [candidate division KSB1 bacterium]
MDAIFKSTVLLALVLALSYLIERILEILKASYDFIDSRLDWHEYWTRRTYGIKNYLEKKLKLFEYLKPRHTRMVLESVKDTLETDPNTAQNSMPVLSGDMVRGTAIKIVAKIFAIAMGIGLAFWIQIDLLDIWKQAAGEGSIWVINIDSFNLRIVISGVVMGLGASPVHKIITAIENKRKEKQQKRR